MKYGGLGYENIQIISDQPFVSPKPGDRENQNGNAQNIDDLEDLEDPGYAIVRPQEDLTKLSSKPSSKEPVSDSKSPSDLQSGHRVSDLYAKPMKKTEEVKPVESVESGIERQNTNGSISNLYAKPMKKTERFTLQETETM